MRSHINPCNPLPGTLHHWGLLHIRVIPLPIYKPCVGCDAPYLQGFHGELAANYGTATYVEASKGPEGSAVPPHCFCHCAWDKKQQGTPGLCQTAPFLWCHDMKGFKSELDISRNIENVQNCLNNILCCYLTVR